MSPNPRTLNSAVEVREFINSQPDKYLTSHRPTVVQNGNSVEIHKDGCVIASLKFGDEFEAKDFFENPNASEVLWNEFYMGDY